MILMLKLETAGWGVLLVSVDDVVLLALALESPKVELEATWDWVGIFGNTSIFSEINGGFSSRIPFLVMRSA